MPEVQDQRDARDHRLITGDTRTGQRRQAVGNASLACGIGAAQGRATCCGDEEAIIAALLGGMDEVASMTYEEWYERIRADNPDMSEYHVRVNARTVARLARQNAAVLRTKQPKAVRLVPLAQPTGFINALYGAIDTTGRMPVVRPKQEEEQAG